MKALVIVGKSFLALSLFFNVAAQAAQEPNPLFLEASDLSEQLNMSALNDNVKSAFQIRFEGLKREQQELWVFAGQVDGGQCQGNCIDLYNSRVMTWESSLRSFNEDARRWLKNQPVDPNLVSQCLRDCDKADDARRRGCIEGPIEEHTSCLRASYERKLDCTNTKCYGITTPIR